MKNIYFIGFVCLFVDVLFSQEFLKDAEKCSTIEYIIKHDNLNPKEGFLRDYTYTMYFDKNQALFLEKDIIESTRADNIGYKQSTDEEIKDAIDNRKEGVTLSGLFYRTDTVDRMYFYNKKDDYIYALNVHEDKWYYKDNAKFNWKISSQTKKIGDYNCQKAECFFRGKRHIAWFSTDLPYSYGPWKFKGLPGMVLESYTEGYARIVPLSINVVTESNCAKKISEYTKELSYKFAFQVPSYKKHLKEKYEKFKEEAAKKIPVYKFLPRWLNWMISFVHKTDEFEKFDESFFEDYEGE